MTGDGSSTLVQRALAGDRAAIRELVDVLGPVIQARVARAFNRARGSSGRNTHQEVADVTQEVFVALFENDGKALRSWKPDGGLSLTNFVGLMAEREVASLLRTGKRSPWKEDATLEEDLVNLGPETDGPQARIESKQLLTTLLDRLRSELSPLGMKLFHLLQVEERSVEEVQQLTGMKPDAIYAWRSRLTRKIRLLAADIESAGLLSDSPGAPRKPNTGT